MQEMIAFIILALIGVVIYTCILDAHSTGESNKMGSASADVKEAMNAIEQGNIGILRVIINKGLPVDSKSDDYNNNSLLHAACLLGEKNIAEYLLDQGADINATNADNHTPLLLSMLFGQADCAILLLQRGANDITGPSVGNTILHDISSKMNIYYFIDKLIEEKKERANTVNPILNEVITAELEKKLQVQLARIRDSNARITKYLLSTGFDLTRKNKAGCTVMDFIYGCENRDIGLLLGTVIEGEDEFATRRATALSSAVIANQPDIIIRLLDIGEDINEREKNTGETALYNAAFEGNNDLVKLLIARGASINIGNYKSQTPLMVATMLNHTEVIQTLIASGADTEIQDYLRETPLFKAASMGNKQAVQILLTAKADPNSQNLTHNTPLMRAAKHGFFEIVKMLVEHGADVNYSYKGISVMDRAWFSGIDELKEYIEAEIKNKGGKS